jgi:hypothetical protein
MSHNDVNEATGNSKRIDLIRQPNVENPRFPRDYGPLQVSRDAELLRGIVTINEYEDFCNTLDELFVQSHARLKRSTIEAWFLIFFIFMWVVVTMRSIIFHYTDNAIFYFVYIPATIFLLYMTVVSCQDSIGCKIEKEIHLKCQKLSDRTANATFQYVETTVSIGYPHDLQMGHIDVVVPNAE